MTRLTCACAAVILVLVVALTRAQSVYPTGTTIYDPDRAWNGYTVLSPLATQAVLVIDMNGNLVQRWEGYNNAAGGPARVLPGGFVIAASGARPPHQESLELVQRDFTGNVVWRFSRNEQITTRDGSTVWSARQHHDWQRDSFPAGYYSPESTPAIEGGNTLILTHTTRRQPKVADVPLEDDRLIEVSWGGDIVWEWVASDRRAFAPRLLEEVYNLEDALLVGGFVNTLLRSADRVRVGCLAQLVNVIAPLVTNETGVLRQSIYYPYAWALRYARGRVLDLRVEADTYPITAAGLQADFARNDQVPFVDVVATLDARNGQASVLMLNRDLDGERELVLEWDGVTPTRVLMCETLTGPDLTASNTFDEPRRVVPQRLEPPGPGARMTFRLPPRSYTAVQLAATS